jgi:hypothetical protein
MAYKVIHNNSAVNNRCRDVLGLVIKVLSKIKNKITKRFISPKNKINKDWEL